MKLREYLKTLNLLVKKSPEILEYEAIISVDDEGNDYKPVVFEPSVGHYDKEDREFYEERKSNSVCVN